MSESSSLFPSLLIADLDVRLMETLGYELTCENLVGVWNNSEKVS